MTKLNEDETLGTATAFSPIFFQGRVYRGPCRK